MASVITAAQAQPGDILLDTSGKAWFRGDELYSWSTFNGLVFFYGEWKDEYGPQGELALLVRGGRPVC